VAICPGRLRQLPVARHGTLEECLVFLKTQRLWGQGVGWNDVRLLVASRLTRALLWSLDLRLMEIARKLKIVYDVR
jgi:hypothetical protein